jgi:hypothetical protein
LATNQAETAGGAATNDASPHAAVPLSGIFPGDRRQIKPRAGRRRY